MIGQRLLLQTVRVLLRGIDLVVSINNFDISNGLLNPFQGISKLLQLMRDKAAFGIARKYSFKETWVLIKSSGI